CVVAEQLLPRIEGTGRVAAYEVMLANNAIRNYIREGKTFQITSTIQTSRSSGMITMDDYIQLLYQNGEIDRDTALQFSRDKISQKNRLM
ncbi:MAG: type IV pili twitching motility protein PilT, partial [Lachnospiraceae bacterium]|nr:type IV pili twitching motility protein PilT [Lachnospiraceae bacterium]